MPSNRPVLVSLVVSFLTVSVSSKYLGPPDAVKMINVRPARVYGDSFAFISWDAFEVDTKSYKIELVSSHDGKSITGTFEKKPGSDFSSFHERIDGLETNETYIVRVFAVNEHGQSPPSPDIILPLRDFGPYCGALPSFEPIIVEYMVGNRVNVTWTVYEDIHKDLRPSEFIIRYGDNKNTSFWNTLKTKNTWIILDDLKKNTQYTAYVIAKKDDSTNLSAFSIPISLDQEMTGLPEPVITIESAFKKEVFTPGELMTVKCSIPPNSNMHDIDMKLTVGDRVASLKSDENFCPPKAPICVIAPLPRLVTSVTLFTTANENVHTAKCKISVGNWYKGRVSRSSYRSWKVEKPLNDEYLKRIYELMGFKNI